MNLNCNHHSNTKIKYLHLPDINEESSNFSDLLLCKKCINNYKYNSEQIVRISYLLKSYLQSKTIIFE